MDIRQLHYFLTLCEEMNYTRAAQRQIDMEQYLTEHGLEIEEVTGDVE